MLTFYVQNAKEENSGQQLSLCKISCQEPLLSHFRKPLNSKTRPLKSMGHNQVIQKRCVLLPDFIFFIDDTLLHSIFKHWNLEKLSGWEQSKSEFGHVPEVTSRWPHLIYSYLYLWFGHEQLTALPEHAEEGDFVHFEINTTGIYRIG